MTGVSGTAGDAGGTASSLARLEQAAAATAVKESFSAGSVIACDRLVRIYTVEGVEIQALQGLDLFIRPGELTAVVGASGSGKSTLLNILSGLDRPTAGQVTVAGHDLLTMKAGERLGYRRAWCYDSPVLYPDVWMTLARCRVAPHSLLGRRSVTNRAARAARRFS